MRKNDAFFAKIVNTRLTKSFMAIFAPAESLPCPATLLPPMFEQYIFFRPVLSWGWWVVVGGLILYFS